MKFTRLNDNEIRCILSEDELGDYGIDLDDIITKNTRTTKFFQELLEEAARTLGMEDAVEIRMASARISVLKDNSISIVFHGNSNKISAEVRKEILDMMEKQLKLSGFDTQEVMDELNSIRERVIAEEAEKEASKNTASGSFMAAFGSIEDAVRFARAVRSAVSAESRLYAEKDGSCYYLLVLKNTLTDQSFGRLRLIASEFGELLALEAAGKAHIEEWCDVLIPNGALLRLAELGD